MSNTYIKRFSVGDIQINFPRCHTLYNYSIIDYKNSRHDFSLSLVYNSALSAINISNISNGFKLSLFKKIIISGSILSYIDSNGEIVSLTMQSNGIYSFNDNSMRILRIVGGNYIVEYKDYSKEVFDSSGNIVYMYDKYDENSPFLSFSYNLTTSFLESISYLSNRQIVLSYNETSTKLESISYYSNNTLINTSYISYSIDSLTLEHYSGIDLHFTISDSTVIVYSTEHLSNYTDDYLEKSECIKVGDQFTINKYIGSALTDTNTYIMLHYANVESADVIDSIDKYGIRNRFIYKNEKLIYSYEMDSVSEDNSFNTNKYKGEVLIFDNKNISGRIGYDDSNPMTYINSNNTYSFELLNPELRSGFFVVSGFIKALDDNLSGYILQNNNFQFDFGPIPLNKWIFISYKFPNNSYQFFNVSFSHNTNFLLTKDFRIEFNDTNLATMEEVIIDGENVLPLIDTDISYLKGGIEHNLYNVSITDLYQVLLNTSKNHNSGEIYSNNLKTVIDSTSNLTISYSLSGETISKTLDELCIGFKIQNGTKYNLISIKFVSINNYMIEIKNLDSSFNVLSKTYLDYNQNEIYKEDEYNYISYTRNMYGNPITKSTNNEYSSSYSYSIDGLYLLSYTNEFNNTTTYTYDSSFDHLLSITYPNGMVKSIDSDIDGKNEISRSFSYSLDEKRHNISYLNGEVSSINISDLIYSFTYESDILSSISKCNDLIRTITHSFNDATKKDTYEEIVPTSISTSYTNTEVFDKYGREEESSDVVNTYDILPYFSGNTHLTLGIDNSSSKLSTSHDLLQNEIHEFEYEKNNLIKKIVKSDDSSSVKRKEEYSYDTNSRLTEHLFYYSGGSSNVSSNITYKEDENSSKDDQRIYTYNYKIDGSSYALTTNFYDDEYDRFFKRNILVGSSNYLSLFSYDKTRIYNILDKRNNSVIRNASFTFDVMGKINSYTDSIYQNNNKTYEYNKFGELTRENNIGLNQTNVYTYDEYGNVLNYKRYPYTLGSLSLESFTQYNFTYDSVFKDRIVSFNNQQVTYDSSGYPINYMGKSLLWSKGKLKKYSFGSIRTGGESHTYSYDAYGNRVSKNSIYYLGLESLIEYTTKKNTTYKYDSYGRLILETSKEYLNTGSTINRTIFYLYNQNEIIGFRYTKGGSTNTYYFDKNIFGDVERIYDSSGNIIVRYAYNAYGECSITYTSSYDIANNIPIRYRGYYQDIESGFYFLKTRYYDPKISRFISPDSPEYLSIDEINGLNLYVYCFNDPVMYSDGEGHFPGLITAMLIGAGVGALVGGVGQAGADVLSNIWRHGFDFSEWSMSSWQTYVGAVVGGAIGGALTPILGPISTAAINGSVSSIVGMGLENITGASNYSFGEILATSVFAGAFSGLTAGFVDKVKIPGITSGRGSLSAIQKQINTKLVKNQISRISAKTFGKMLILELYNSLPSNFLNSFTNGIVLTPITDSY